MLLFLNIFFCVEIIENAMETSNFGFLVSYFGNFGIFFYVIEKLGYFWGIFGIFCFEIIFFHSFSYFLRIIEKYIEKMIEIEISN